MSIEPYPTPNFIEQDLIEILESVSFVDKIVFGRLNYNAKSALFKQIRNFYNDLSLKIITFCNKNKINYYIKVGTQTEAKI